MLDNKLSSIIKYKLPAFVRDEHDMFVAFVQSFFEYAEREGGWLNFMNRYQRNLDVDNADDDFIDRYVQEFVKTFPKNTKVDTKTLLKLMREFYLSKGSEDSFHFIFRILYDTDIDIIYPRESLYVPSSGNYASATIIYITGENWNKFDNLSDVTATIERIGAGAGAVVDTITTTFVNNELALKLEVSSLSGEFTPGEVVNFSVNGVVVEERVHGCVRYIDVIDGGTNYEINDELTITDSSTGQRAKAKISKLRKGGLSQVNIISAGTGYQVGDVVQAEKVIGSNGYGFRAYVYEVGASGEIVRVRVDAEGYDYSQTTNAIVKSDTGSGAIIELNGENIGKIDSIEVTDGGVGYSDPATITITIDTKNGYGATLNPVLSGVFVTPKVYLNERSTLSGNSKIQDSYYYQQYSYVIRSKVSPHKWIGTIKRIAHPVGTQLFGMYSLESEFDISVDIAPDFTNAIGKNLKFFIDIMNDFVDAGATERQMERYSVPHCVLGQTTTDLDDVKFDPQFNWEISYFSDLSVEDVVSDCSNPMNILESSVINVT